MAVFDSEELNELLKQAQAAFDALSPLEKAFHRRDQAISFAYGQVALSGSKATKEQVAQGYDNLHPWPGLEAVSALQAGMRALA